MHLLVLSAFRPFVRSASARAEATVSMHLLVLSAFRPKTEAGRSQSETGSQCTFWCSVLSDPTIPTNRREMMCLNAPSGAQCFPTRCRPQRRTRPLWVSMHLLVLSAFRPRRRTGRSSLTTSLNAPSGAQCFPTCLRWRCKGRNITPSQCTFWCSVLSDTSRGLRKPSTPRVSMHLLVPSAFRPRSTCPTEAPASLNAPSGAQCFPTEVSHRSRSRRRRVSMHLLVLSAFRPKNAWLTSSSLMCGLNAPSGAQCFPTCNRA